MQNPISQEVGFLFSKALVLSLHKYLIPSTDYFFYLIFKVLVDHTNYPPSSHLLTPYAIPTPYLLPIYALSKTYEALSFMMLTRNKIPPLTPICLLLQYSTSIASV